MFVNFTVARLICGANFIALLKHLDLTQSEASYKMHASAYPIDYKVVYLLSHVQSFIRLQNGVHDFLNSVDYQAFVGQKNYEYLNRFFFSEYGS